MKYLVLAILAFVSIEQALGLECYVTDVDSLRNNRRLSNSVQNCDTYMRSMMTKFGIPDLGISLPASCYQMRVSTGNPATDFVVKGCVPTTLCDMFVKPIVTAEAQKSGVYPQYMQCNECYSDYCNAY